MADPLRTEEERKTVTQKILNLTLEIIYLITGEDYSVVAKTSGDHVTPLTYSYISGEWTRNESPIMDPPLYSLILEEKNTSKILEVINKITELLTAEMDSVTKVHQKDVPILRIPRIITRFLRMMRIKA